MKNPIITRILPLIIAMFVAQQLCAHRLWLLPSTTVLSGTDQWVSVEGAVSNDLFFPNHFPIALERTSVTAPDGTAVELHSATQGKIRSSFEFLVEQEGTYTIEFANSMYFARWTEAGSPKHWRGSKEQLIAQGLLEREGAKIMHNASKVLSYVTCGEPDYDIFELRGSGLEIVPETHPNDIFAGELAVFTLYKDGQPAEGVEFTLVRGNDRFRNEPEALKVTSDAEGKLAFQIEKPGRYWLSGRLRGGEGEIENKKIDLSYGYTLTFEVFPE